MLNTRPTLPVKDKCPPDQLETNLRIVPDAQLYRMIYIEPGRYSAEEIRAAQHEMDFRAVGIKVVSQDMPHQSKVKKRNRFGLKEGSLYQAENFAPYAAFMGLVYIAIALVFHWVNREKISYDHIWIGIIWFCISAAVYIYLVFRHKPTKPTRRK